MKKLFMRGLLVIAVVIVIAAIVFYSWAMATYESSEELQRLVQLDEMASV